jgi:ribosomal protein S18 acetylase RimI-like enzyme
MSLKIVSFEYVDTSNQHRMAVSEILQSELYHDIQPVTRDYRIDMAETEDLRVLALLHEGLVVATASIRTDTLANPITRIRNVAVMSTYKKLGFGRQILTAAEKHIINDGSYSGPRLAMVRPSDTAVGFYTKMGYRYISDTSEYMAKAIS